VPPIRVRTHPGSTQFTRTPLPFVAAASCIVSAFNAAFEIEYAGAYVPIDDSCPAPDDTFTTRPYRRSIIDGTNAWHTISGPQTFVSHVSWKASIGVFKSS
jgi:hypothetical protein